MQLEVKEINKVYQKKIQALDRINITFENGIYGLLGPKAT